MIKLLTAMSGHTFNYPIGEIVSLDKDYEKRLIDSGQAVKVETVDVETPEETVDVETPEETVAKKTTKPKKKAKK